MGKLSVFGRVYGRFGARRLADTEKIGRHEREIAYVILLLDSPILIMGAAKKYDITKIVSCD